jgi:hypothetical protein
VRELSAGVQAVLESWELVEHEVRALLRRLRDLLEANESDPEVLPEVHHRRRVGLTLAGPNGPLHPRQDHTGGHAGSVPDKNRSARKR